MPRYWHDYFANALPEDATNEDVNRREFNLRILADKKPYFMCYIYPKLMKDYKDYVKTVSAKCMTMFRTRLSDLLAIPEHELDSEQAAFIQFYKRKCPVSIGDCVVNKICRRFEEEFDGSKWLGDCADRFDPSILKSGVKYKDYHYYALKKLYKKHHERIKAFSSEDRVRKYPKREVNLVRENFVREFTEAALWICSNEEQLCDMAVDLCYKNDSSKQFIWDVCCSQMMNNLLSKNGGIIHYPIPDPDGDFEYAGQTYSMIKKESTVWLKSL